MKTTLSLKALLRECRTYVASEPLGDADRSLLARIDRVLAGHEFPHARERESGEPVISRVPS